ncbi:MAG: thrombospondin type 3 repeat-containing protein [Pseudomonadales bacterium]|nr:thrombospondin type 3 repeat-containing protein [Pseudomonadales bacterium]
MGFLKARALTKYLIALFLLFIFSTSVSADGPITNGDSPTGTISPVGDVDHWTFSANAGENILVQLGELSGTDFQPFLRLYDPLGNLIASNFGNSATNLNTQATIGGTYTIDVLDATATPDGTATYELFLYVASKAFIVPTGDEGGVLLNGAAHAGDIHLGDIDVWSFTADTQDTVLLQVAEVTDGGGFNPYLALYGPEGNLLEHNFGNTATGLNVQIAQGGTYTVVVREYNADVEATGSYNLYYANVGQSFIIQTGDEGGTLSNGGVHAGEILLADVDIWTFNADALDTVLLQLGEVSDGGGFDPRLMLYDAQGNLVAENFGNTATNLNIQLTLGGQYTVVVREYNADVEATGTYNLYYTNVGQDFVVPTGDEGGPLTNGGVHGGEIELGDMDTWRFTADALDTVHIQLGEVVDGGGFDPRLMLFDAQGNLVSENFGNTATNLNVQLTQGGQYTVVVREYNADVEATGTYNLYYTNVGQDFVVPTGDEGGSLINGEVHGGEITLGDIDVWRFTADALDTVHIHLGEVVDGGGFDPRLMLYDAQGNLVSENFGNTATNLNVQLTQGGQYTVVVREYNSDVEATGSYNLFYANVGQNYAVPTGDEGGVLSQGDTESGVITLGDVDMWSIAVDANDQIDLTVTETLDNGGFEPRILLYDTFGTLLANNAGTTSASVSVTAPAKGTYVAVIRENNSDVEATGNYEISYSRVENSSTVPSGNILATLNNGGFISGEFTTGSDIDKFDVSISSGQIVRMQLADLDNTTNNTPILNVFDPSGNLVALNSHGTLARVEFIAQTTGIYTIAVQNAVNTTNTYDYRLYGAISQQGFVIPDSDEGGALSNGALATGSLAVADYDMYSLVVQPGDQVRLRLGDTSNTTNHTPVLKVYRADGTLLGSASNATMANLYFIAESAETLTVMVNNSVRVAGTYNYALSTAISPQAYSVPAGDEGGLLVNGEITSGSLSIADTDIYSLSVNAGDFVRLLLGDTNNTTNHSPALQVYREDGTLVGSVAHATMANLAFSADASQTFTVIVRNNVVAAGTYTYALSTAISQQGYTTASGDEGGLLSNGLVASGSLSLADMDIYTLPVQPGDMVRLRVGDKDNTTNHTPAVQVFHEDGTLLATTSNATVANLNFVANTTENLRVIIRNGLTTAGTYDYDLFTAISQQPYAIPVGDEGGELSNGGVVSGDLTIADMDMYSLAVEPGDHVRVRVGDVGNTTNHSPALQIFSADGSLLAEAVNATIANIHFVADTQETLTLVLRNGVVSAGTHSYNLHTAVSKQPFIVPLADQGGVLVNGVSQTGVSTIADMDIYSLSVSANDVVTITVSDDDNTTNHSPAVQVYAANGVTLASTYHASLAALTFIAPSDSALMVVVRNAVKSAGTYDYTISATGANGVTDTDGDGLSDADEVEYGTDINHSDSDGDGLTDGDEVNNWGSDPHLIDTDGDGYTDLEEAVAGTSPTDPNDHPGNAVQEEQVPMPIWMFWVLALGISIVAKQRSVRD